MGAAAWARREPDLNKQIATITLVIFLTVVTKNTGDARELARICSTRSSPIDRSN